MTDSEQHLAQEPPGFFSRHKLAIGVGFYSLTAFADATMTSLGLGDNLLMEGNPIVRRVMETLGVAGALATLKIGVGLICVAVAWYGETEIKRRAPWIAYLPMLPKTRRWMASGDRSWIAYIPLYGSAVAWGCAASAWAFL